MYLTTQPQFKEDGERPVYSHKYPCSMVFVCALFVAMAFLHVFTVSTDTVLFSFLWDEQLLAHKKVIRIACLQLHAQCTV